MLRAPSRSPSFTVLANPIQKRAFEPDIVAKSFRFEPFVAEDFFAFSEEFLIKSGLLYEVTGWLGLSWGRCHGDHGGAVLEQGF